MELIGAYISALRSDAILKKIGGSWAHITQLAHHTATEATAQLLAQLAFEESGFTDEERVFLEGLTPAQKQALLAVARQMQQSP